jgi:hypothetical protein
LDWLSYINREDIKSYQGVPRQQETQQFSISWKCIVVMKLIYCLFIYGNRPKKKA